MISLKVVVVMWILTLSDLSAEKKIYDGSLDDCLLTVLSFNQVHEGKKYSGCYTEVRQYDFVPRD
jgi:hypothetical protein